MDTGKVLDIEAMIRYFQSCISNKRYENSDPARYQTWKDTHICKINRAGSALVMESNGATRIFKCSAFWMVLAKALPL